MQCCRPDDGFLPYVYSRTQVSLHLVSHHPARLQSPQPVERKESRVSTPLPESPVLDVIHCISAHITLMRTCHMTTPCENDQVEAPFQG